MTGDNSDKPKASRFHRHNPILLIEKDAVAVTPKKNDPKCCVGDLKKCLCGALIFFPHTLGLYPVEVELIEQKKAAKAAKAA